MLTLYAPWKIEEHIQETYEHNQFTASFCGVQATDGNLTVTGSSVSTQSDMASLLAHYELLERIAIVEHKDRMQHQSEVYKRSISSGVAAHTDPVIARWSAMFELVERDLVLKSWYGCVRPAGGDFTETLFSRAHETEYKFERYILKYADDCDFIGTVCVGWPRQASVPLIIGFAASDSETDSFDKAHREMVQKYLFLKDENLLNADPVFEASPMYHQDYYLNPENTIKLKGWLRGNHYRLDSNIQAPKLSEFEFRTLKETDEYSVVQALHARMWPLYFGYYDYPELQAGSTSQFPPHPIA